MVETQDCRSTLIQMPLGPAASPTFLRSLVRIAAEEGDTSGGNSCFVVARLAQDVPAAPHRLDVVLAARRIGELLA